LLGDNFEFYFSTASILALPSHKWVPIKEIASELDKRETRLSRTATNKHSQAHFARRRTTPTTFATRLREHKVAISEAGDVVVYWRREQSPKHSNALDVATMVRRCHALIVNAGDSGVGEALRRYLWHHPLLDYRKHFQGVVFLGRRAVPVE